MFECQSDRRQSRRGCWTCVAGMLGDVRIPYFFSSWWAGGRPSWRHAAAAAEMEGERRQERRDVICRGGCGGKLAEVGWDVVYAVVVVV